MNRVDGELQRLLDREAIRDSILRYARSVDRSDWDGVRAAYHPDAHDDHGGYKGDVDGLVAYLDRLFPPTTNGVHFIGNCLIEFVDNDLALVETYFISQRIVDRDAEAGGEARRVRLGWGRYVDRFERRGGAWRVARRIVVMDASYFDDITGGAREGPAVWGSRSAEDPLFQLRAEMLED